MRPFLYPGLPTERCLAIEADMEAIRAKARRLEFAEKARESIAKLKGRANVSC